MFEWKKEMKGEAWLTLQCEIKFGHRKKSGPPQHQSLTSSWGPKSPQEALLTRDVGWISLRCWKCTESEASDSAMGSYWRWDRWRRTTTRCEGECIRWDDEWVHIHRHTHWSACKHCFVRGHPLKKNSSFLWYRDFITKSTHCEQTHARGEPFLSINPSRTLVWIMLAWPRPRSPLSPTCIQLT